MNKEERILSVDWDYFFKLPAEDEYNLYDWGCRESEVFINGALWLIRASSFYEFGQPIPMTTGEEVCFWDRFKFSPGCKVVAVDSHAHLAKYLNKNVAEVVSYDAHHDSYNELECIKETGTVHCEDWATWAVYLGIVVNVRYPMWRAFNPDNRPKEDAVATCIDHGEEDDKSFDLVFICRSGAWTPPWIDKDFVKFIESCPIQQREVSVSARPIDLAEAEKMGSTMLTFMEQHRLHQQDDLLGKEVTKVEAPPFVP